MALIERFITNEMGGITFTGNTLGLSRSATAGVPGTLDSIGAFTTTDTSLQYGSYPPGTTNDFNLNSSSAILNLPAGSEVLYAELIWGGTYIVGSDDFSSFIDKSVNFITPDGVLHVVGPDPTTAFSGLIDASPVSYIYMRSANVTSIVQQEGAGIYTAGAIVGTITIPSDTNCCSWTLTVVYQNSTLPFRNLSLFVGGVILSSSTPVTTTISGFGTPPTGPLNGRLSLAALEGDANIVGEQLYFGPNTASLTQLSGPNNYPLNFFASQINNDEGLLDTTGTFGTRNQINGSPGTNVVGGRQGLDITTVDVSGQLINSQTSATLRFLTTNESYLPTAFGLQIDINAPDLTIVKSADVSQAAVGDTVTYTISIENSGTANAEATFFDLLAEGITLVDGSVYVNGILVPDVNPITGIVLGTIEPGGSMIVSFQVIVTSIPSNFEIINQSLVSFTYQSVIGGPILDGEVSSNVFVIPVLVPSLGLIKSVDPSESIPGDSVLYTLMVRNTGSVTINNIVITDTLIGFEETLSSLEPGVSTLLTFSYIIPAGTPARTIIRNTATAVSDETESVTAEAFLSVLPSYALSITKTPDRLSANPGETVNYTLEVVNQSNTQLTNIIVSDSLTGFEAVIAELNALESSVFEVAYKIPPETMAGSIISNVGTAFTQESGPASDTAQIVIGAVPDLLIVKTASKSTAAPGEIIIYTITVANEGNSNLTNVHLVDALLEIDETFNLNIGDSIQHQIPFTIPLTATQEEIIRNVATVTSDQTGSESANADVVVLGQTSIHLSKTVLPDITTPGSTVTYTFVVQNTGTTPLDNVLLVDPLIGVIEQIGELAAGESSTITVNFIVPADATEDIVNTATVTGNFNTVNVTSSDDAALQLLFPAFTLSKSADPVQAVPGQTILFSYSITNTGGIPLTNIVLTDPLIGFTDTLSLLAPGATESGTLLFTIPEGTPVGTVYTNVLTAKPVETDAQEALAAVTVLGAPSISLIKTVNVSTALPGDVVTYTITVTNTGNEPLTAVGVADDLLGLDDVIPTLAILGTQTYVLTYTIPVGTPIGTIITNISTVVSNETESIEAIAHVAVGAGPFIVELVKTATPEAASPGENIQYAITVTNPNGIPLTNVFLIDDMLGISENLGTFAAGEARTLIFSYVIPVGTVAGTVLTNTSVVTSDETNAVHASATVTVSAVPGIALAKVFLPGEGKPGQIVTARLTVQNTGNTDLNDVLVSDPLLNLTLTIPSMPAGASQVLSVPFTVPSLAAGSIVTNTASAFSDQTGETFAYANLTVLTAYTATLTKFVDRPSAAPGETVTFTYIFENLSNVPITDIRFEDLLLGIVQTANILAPNIRIVGSRTYTIPLGTPGGTRLFNTVILTSAEIPLLEAQASLIVKNAPAFSIFKTVFPSIVESGNEVMFRLSGINKGNIPLQNIQISDPMLHFQANAVNVDPGVQLFVTLPYIVPESAEPESQIINWLYVTVPGLPPQQASAAVTVVAPLLTIVKETRTRLAFLDDTFMFTLLIRNTGTVAARDVVITDFMPEGLSFVPGSVMVKREAQPYANPETGIPLGLLAPDQSIVIEFQVKVIMIPDSHEARNIAAAAYFRGNASQRSRVNSNLVIVELEDHEE